MNHPAAVLDRHPFQPPRLLRNPRLQTILASSRYRVPARLDMVTCQQEHILKTPGGVVLQSFISETGQPMQPRIILLHGWEGSVQSAYMLSTGEALFRSGYGVVRLHFRDHGNTHGLNREPFRSDRIAEIADAVTMLCEMNPDVPVALMGFSLGGNFAIRTARELSGSAPPNLLHVIGICPLLNPAHSTRLIDGIPWLRRYFMQKWFRGLRKKEVAFPDIYDFSDIYEMENCWQMTDELIRRYSDYPSVEAYFDSYTVTGDRLSTVTVPSTIVTAADDPVIPVADFRELKLSTTTRLHINRHGGHCGFIENWSLKSWVNRAVPDLLEQAFINGSASE